MAKLLTICENCGFIFPFIPIEMSDNSSVIFEPGVIVSGICANCGYECQVEPEGVYTSIKGIVEFLGTERSVSELQQLNEIFENARNKRQSATEISEILDRELPQFSPLSHFISKYATPANLLAFLSIVIATLSLMLDWKVYQDGKQKKPDTTPEQIVNQTFNTKIVNQTFNINMTASPSNKVQEQPKLPVKPKTQPYIKKKRVGVRS